MSAATGGGGRLSWLTRWATLAVLFVVWELVAGVWLPKGRPELATLLPPPSAIAKAAVEMVGSGELLMHLWQSLRRELIAFLFALFAVPGEHYLAPFESVWCDRDESRPEGLLAGPSTSSVARFYARHGVTLDAREMPDHLGCELSFLASLDDLDVARSFAREHPARFVEALAAAAARDGEARFYPAVLAFAAALVRRIVS